MKEQLKDIAKKFGAWVFGNLAWTILSSIISSVLFIPFIYSIIIENAVTLLSLLLLILGLVLEIFIWTRSRKFAQSKTSVNTKDIKDSEEDEYKKVDYYFEEYHKHLTVYSNGNGIIINSFTIVVNNIDSITQFKRELNINDAKKETEFPELEIMKKTELKDRFKKFGFWCKCLNNDKLILSIEEKYWTEKDEDSDLSNKMNPKVLKWILRMNPSSIEVGKPYKIVYVMSIPGMFPIVEGYFNEESANIKDTVGNFSSRVQVSHRIKKFYYTVSFENGIELCRNPTGTIVEAKNGTQNKNLHFINDSNIIYYKYIFSVDNPEFSSAINICWQFKTE